MRTFQRALALILALCLSFSATVSASAVSPTYSVTSDYQATEWYQALLDVQPSGNQATDFLNVALSQAGYHEGSTFHNDGKDPDGNQNYSEYGYWYGLNAQPWCAMFVSWCSRQAGISSRMYSTALASAPSFGVTAFARESTPKPGDLVFFYYENGAGWAHVAIVLHVTDESIYTVEGNMSNMVRIRCLPRNWDRIRCYGSWTAETTSLQELGITQLNHFVFDLNGGTGEMASVCTYNDVPVQFFQNKVSYEQDGTANYQHFFQRNGYTFCGWYLRRESDQAWLTADGFQSAAAITENGWKRTLLSDGATFRVEEGWTMSALEQFRCFAVWKDSSGRIVEENAYLPTADSEGWVNPFRDLWETDWYYPAIRALKQRGILSGTGMDTFSPTQSITRGMLVSTLWRMEQQPDAENTEQIFTDVPTDRYDAPAIAWAAETGLISGYGNGYFGPNDAMSREQMAAVISRYASGKARSSETGQTVEPGAESDSTDLFDLTVFEDWEQISNYALEDVRWAVSTGLLNGVTDSRLEPNAPATRAQCASILYRILPDSPEDTTETAIDQST